MADPSDYELLKTPSERPRRVQPRRPAGLWVAVAGLVAATAIAAYIAFGGRQEPESATAAPEGVGAAQPPQPLGGDPASIVVPPLDESDPLVRELVRMISSHPAIVAWLATDGLIRNFTVAVANTAEGKTPAAHLQVLRPSAKFQVVERGGNLYVDPRSFERYDNLAGAVESIEPAGAARLYGTLKPRIEEAHRDLGFPEASFDCALERVIVQLLEVPASDAAVRVEPKGIGYGFVDPGLEGLTGAQKQLLRMGARNVRIIQSSLREIALALGIPTGRLPAAGPDARQ